MFSKLIFYVSLVASACAKDTLVSDEKLIFDEKLTSSDGNYTLLMQRDANLVLYDTAGNALWSSGTHNQGLGPFHAIMQTDCNFVVYDEQTNEALWSSGGELCEGDDAGTAVLKVQNDGNLVIYRTSTRPTWDRHNGSIGRKRLRL